MIGDLVRAVVRHVTDPPAACAIQTALDTQRRADVAEVLACGSCGGLGIVADYANRIEVWDLGEEYPSHTYGGKVCPECGGIGWR